MDSLFDKLPGDFVQVRLRVIRDEAASAAAAAENDSEAAPFRQRLRYISEIAGEVGNALHPRHHLGHAASRLGEAAERILPITSQCRVPGVFWQGEFAPTQQSMHFGSSEAAVGVSSAGVHGGENMHSGSSVGDDGGHDDLRTIPEAIPEEADRSDAAARGQSEQHQHYGRKVLSSWTPLDM